MGANGMGVCSASGRAYPDVAAQGTGYVSSPL